MRKAHPSKPVLVVEDHEDTREMLETMLRLEGYAVRTAANGEDALESIVGEVPCIILLDVGMPVMDGLTFARRLRELPAPIGKIPIIILSGAVTRTNEIQREVSAVAVLIKPVPYDCLVETVGRICSELDESV